MSDITLINDSEQSSLVTNGLAKNGEMYLKKAGSTDAGAIVVYDSGAWRTFANEGGAFINTYSLSFDGTNDYATSSYTPATSSGATISLWIKMPNLTLNSAPYVSGEGTNAATGSLSFILHKTIGYYVQVGNGTSASFHHSSTGFGTGNAVTSSSSNGYITDNLWHHLAVTINGTALKLYIDGGDASINASRTSNNQGTPYLTATSSISYTGGIGSGTKIGQGHPTFYPKIAACLMDEIAYFESALSGSQISSTYNGGVPGDLTSPAVWWRMGDDDSGTGSLVTDQGSAGQNLTTQNGPTFSTDVPS